MIVAHRDRRPLEDDGFIFSSWLTSRLSAVGMATDSAARTEMHREITDTLRASRCMVAVAPDDDTSIVGYGVEHGGSLKWVYVKFAFRRMGIGRGIAEALGCAWPSRSDGSSCGQPSRGIDGAGDDGHPVAGS